MEENNEKKEFLLDSEKDVDFTVLDDNIKTLSNLNQIRDVSRQMGAITKGFIQSSAFDSIIKQQELLGGIMQSSAFNNILKQQEMFRNILPDISASLVKSLDIYKASIFPQIQNSILPIIQNINTSFVSGLTDILEKNNIGALLKGLTSGLSDIFKDIDLTYKDRLHPRNIDSLNRFYWVVPFEYSQKQIDKISDLKVKSFNLKMEKYFTDKRVVRMFNAIIRNTKEPNKKQFIKQCKTSYFNGDYALCITGMITLLDGLTLELLDDNSNRKHLSYGIIRGLKEEVNENIKIGNYVKYLKLCVADSFYSRLYCIDCEVPNIKTDKSRTLKRSVNSHGARYSNKKIDALRIINAVNYTQDIISDFEYLKDCFKIEKKYFPYAVLNYDKINDKQ